MLSDLLLHLHQNLQNDTGNIVCRVSLFEEGSYKRNYFVDILLQGESEYLLDDVSVGVIADVHYLFLGDNI